jgi:hypothetical protein
MIALAFALALFVPGPNDPVCDPAAGVVTECAQGQLPGEVIGREIGTEPAPAPARHLASTGVPTLPYLVVSAGLIGAGVLLRRRATATTAARSAD